jgi:hypothetical protein
MKKLRSLNDLMAEAAPTSAPAKRATSKAAVTQQQLVVQLPAVTIKALKVAALERDSTVRAVLLDAVQKAGYPVPSGQAVDLRKV